jgi:hypothetical protein
VEAAVRSQSQICNQQIGRHRQDVLTRSLKIAACRNVGYRGQDPLQCESASDIRFDNQDALGCGRHVESRRLQDAGQFRADLHSSWSCALFRATAHCLLDLPRVSRDSVRFDFERISVHLPVTPQFEPTTETDEITDATSAWDLRRLITVGSNMLIRGEKSAATATVVALSADLSIPLVTWTAGSNVSLPALRQGTVVLQDVDRLELSAQRELLAWLDERGGCVRVISTARGDLFALVMSGEFLDPLYYRLNTIVVDATAMDGCQAQ